MAVTINLLPDVTQVKRSTKERRRLATVSAISICGTSLGVMALLFVVTQAQNISLGNLQKNIDSKQSQIEATPNLQAMLTTQQHLLELPKLYDQRNYTSKVFTLISSFTPKDIFYSALELDSTGSLKLSGRAKNYAGVTKLVRVFEGAGVTVGPAASTTSIPLFTQVALTSATNDIDGKASFVITAVVDSGVTHGDQ